MADMIYLLSNNSDVALTPDGLRELAVPQTPSQPLAEPSEFTVHRLSARLGGEQIDEVILRYGNGESARSLAAEYEVAPSALIRLLRERKVVVRQQVVTAEMEQTLALGYETGMTVAELKDKHKLSHGAVLRALHRAGVEMRAKAPRKKLA
jgi:Mor family transcriptional regulator